MNSTKRLWLQRQLPTIYFLLSSFLCVATAAYFVLQEPALYTSSLTGGGV